MDWNEIKAACDGFVQRSDRDWDALQPVAWSAVDEILDVDEQVVQVEIEPAASAVIAGLLEASLPSDYLGADMVMCGAREIESCTLQQLVADTARQGFAVSGGVLYLRATGAGEGSRLFYKAKMPALGGTTITHPVATRYPNVLISMLVRYAFVMEKDFLAAEYWRSNARLAADDANMQTGRTKRGGGGQMKGRL